MKNKRSIKRNVCFGNRDPLIVVTTTVPSSLNKATAGEVLQAHRNLLLSPAIAMREKMDLLNSRVSNLLNPTGTADKRVAQRAFPEETDCMTYKMAALSGKLPLLELQHKKLAPARTEKLEPTPQPRPPGHSCP